MISSSDADGPACSRFRANGGGCGSDSSRGIQSFVDKPVGFPILLAKHVLNLEGVESSNHALRLLEEHLQSFVPDLVSSLHLADEKFRVGNHFQSRDATRKGVFERSKQSSVLGFIVRGFTNTLGKFLEGLTIGSLDHDAISSRSRVPPRAAVDMGGRFYAVSGIGHEAIWRGGPMVSSCDL